MNQGLSCGASVLREKDTAFYIVETIDEECRLFEKYRSILSAQPNTKRFCFDAIKIQKLKPKCLRFVLTNRGFYISL